MSLKKAVAGATPIPDRPVPPLLLRIAPGASSHLPGLWAAGLVLERDPGLAATALPDPRRVIDPTLTLDNLKDHDTAAAYRTLSWTVGIDPTKHRPAGEALARRILNDKPLPRIHPLVDAYNLASAATLVPLGAYDLDHIHTPLSIDTARPATVFHGIGRDPEAVDPGRIVYCDAHGNVCGVFLWRDALHSRVRDTTRRVLILSVGADPVPITVGRDALGETARLAAHAGFRASGDIIQATPT